MMALGTYQIVSTTDNVLSFRFMSAVVKFAIILRQQ